MNERDKKINELDRAMIFQFIISLVMGVGFFICLIFAAIGQHTGNEEAIKYSFLGGFSSIIGVFVSSFIYSKLNGEKKVLEHERDKEKFFNNNPHMRDLI